MSKISITTMLFALLSLTACGSNNSNIGPDDGGGSTPPPSEVSLTIDNTAPISENNKVIYELNLYDFTTEGTLHAATNKLGNLRKLGVDIIWLMPIHPRGVEGRIGAEGSPYAVKDFYAVNPDFGTLGDLKAFITSAHQKGMNVWMDWVPNHTALDNVWVTEHPEYYTKEDGKFVNPNGYGDVYQLNMSDQETQEAMTEAMEYWINQADIDGFRCDYASSPSIPPAFWTNVIPKLKSIKGSFKVMAEADLGEKKQLLNSGFDYDYAWSFHTKLQNFGMSSDAATLKNDCQQLVGDNKFNDMNRMVYLTNHDDIGNNFDSNYISYLGANRYPLSVLEFTLYGMPLLYNGQEIGYTKLMNYFNREPIDWTAVDNKARNTVRVLVALKHTQKALTQGTIGTRAAVSFLTTDNPAALAYTKVKDGNTVLVVLSFASNAQEIVVSGVPAGDYTQWIDSKTISTKVTGKDVTLTPSSTISLDAHGYAVYVMK